MALKVGGVTVTGTQTLDATKLTGNLPAISGASLTSLNGSNIGSGTVPNARISLDAGEIPSLDASKITSGTFANARISSSSVTQHASSVTNTSGTWTPGVVQGSVSVINAHYQRVGDMVTATAHFGSTGNSGTSNSLWYFSGLPVTSRNLGNSHRNAGLGHLICSRGGTQGALVVKSSSTVMYFMNGGDVRNLSDMQGLSTGSGQRSPSDVQHYATRNNFYNATKGIYSWSNSTNKHFMISITYLV